MHLLETKYQREWADDEYAGQPLEHLDQIGLMSPSLTVAHGVWLRADECELLADRGVTVCVNPSSNLRLRSGSAPVQAFSDAGVPLALGLDSLSLNDDGDILREVRLAHLLYAQPGFHETITYADMLDACVRAPAVGRGDAPAGAFEPGYSADVVFLDRGVLDPFDDGSAGTLLESVRSRASSAAVRRLFVRGRLIVDDGRVVTVDEPGLLEDLAGQVTASAPRVSHPELRQLQSALADYYTRGGHRNERSTVV